MMDSKLVRFTAGEIAMDTQTYTLISVDDGVYDIYRSGQMDLDPIGRGHVSADDKRVWFMWAVIVDGGGEWIEEFRAKFTEFVKMRRTKCGCPTDHL